MVDSQPSGAEGAARGADAFGSYLREARTRRRLSQSELARRLGLSAGMISQLEKGLSLPSVSTMLAIAAELDVSLDSLFGTTPVDEAVATERRPTPSLHLPAPAPIPSRTSPSDIFNRILTLGGPTTAEGIESAVQRYQDRAVLTLEDGVTWELLTTDKSHRVLFVVVTYPVGAATTAERAFVRHPDVEYFLMVEGELVVSLEFEKTTVRAGDAMWFDSMRPHFFENHGDVPARGVFFIIPQ
jgi:transcriptional regulator with XRE-family HTH domain